MEKTQKATEKEMISYIEKLTIENKNLRDYIEKLEAKQLSICSVVKSVKENTKRPLTNRNNEDSIKAFWNR